MENGETWASDALKGNKELYVTFEVDDRGPDGPVVKVSDVAPTLQDSDVALFAHGHYLRILAATYLRQDPRFGAHLLLDAGALCVLEHERGVPAVRTWNEAAGG